MPMARHAGMMRTAISPRFAMRILFIGGSERNVAVLLRRVPVALGLERREPVDQLRARLARTDDLVEEAALRGHERVRELLAVLRDLRRARRGDVGGRVELPPLEDG